MQNDWTDQLGRKLNLKEYPIKIVSLVPSITETLIHNCTLSEVVGRTKFCIHPKTVVKSIKRVGGTKQVNYDIIRSLEPDLIIANKEENTQEMIGVLEKDFPVYVSNIPDILSFFSFLETMDQLLQAPSLLKLKNEIQNRRSLYQKPSINPSVVYLIWRKPYMTIGGDTFIHNMLEEAGFRNLYSHQSRYPEVTLEDIRDKNPDYILLSSEPYPFQQKHISELNVLVSKSKIRLVDGELFSWYGVRLLKAYDYFETLHKSFSN